jgi:hypothetical protein
MDEIHNPESNETRGSLKKGRKGMDGAMAMRHYEKVTNSRELGRG